MAALLGTAKEVTAFHEPKPQMVGDYVRMVNDLDYDSTLAARSLKGDAIAKTLRPGRVYCETSHMFIKTYFDVVLARFGSSITVLHLQREMASVLKSFVELGYFSERNLAWRDWMTQPGAATAALECLAPEAEMDQHDRCIAYLLDIEARAVRFRSRYPETLLVTVRLDELNSISRVAELFSTLRITPTAATETVCGRPINQRAERKAMIQNPASLSDCRSRIASYVARARKQGIGLPHELVERLERESCDIRS